MSEPDNIDRPPLRVRFFDLERYDPERERDHKSICPACGDGLLLMHRDSRGRLLAEDICALCGQHVVYTDIARVRKERP